jgi:hypothetical protein
MAWRGELRLLKTLLARRRGAVRGAGPRLQGLRAGGTGGAVGSYPVWDAAGGSPLWG